MNEVVPLSHRAGAVMGSAGSRVRAALTSAWNWYTGLGQGTWMLTLAVLIVAGVGIAMVDGGHAGDTPCAQSSPIVQEVESAATGSNALEPGMAASLHLDATKLQTISKDASATVRSALQRAATVAAGARAGQPFHPLPRLQVYDTACDFGAP